MPTSRLQKVLRREARGIIRLTIVLAIAGSALLLPRVSSTAEASITRFSKPPPGTATIEISIDPSGQLIDGIQVKTLENVKCGPFTFLYSPPTVSFIALQVDNGLVNQASGSFIQTVTCDNKWYTYTGVATLANGSVPFHTGSILIETTITACGYNGNNQYQCATGFKSGNVTLK